MNTLKLMNVDDFGGNDQRIFKQNFIGKHFGYFLFFLLMLSIWTLQQLIVSTDSRLGFIDPNIWLLILISLVSFLIVTGLCWWLVQQFWMSLGLPALGMMVLSFNTLPLWKQLGFWLASFACLLLGAVLCLLAIC